MADQEVLKNNISIMDKNGGKSLQEWLDEFYEDSGKLSDIVRNLAFAGIGLIWIFRNPDPINVILPRELILPINLIVLGLIFDLIQYIWRSVTIYFLYRKNEEDKKFNNITMPNWLRDTTWIFFVAKIILIAAAYLFIYKYLMGRF